VAEDDDFNKPISFGFSDALRDADNIVKDEGKRKNAELGRLSTIFGQRIGKASKDHLMAARHTGETKVVFESSPEFPEVTSRGDGGTGALYLDPSKIIELNPSKRGWREQFLIKIDKLRWKKIPVKKEKKAALVAIAIPAPPSGPKIPQYLANLDHHFSAIKIWQSKNLDVMNSISIKELCDHTAYMIMKSEPGFEVSIKIKSTDPETKDFEPFSNPIHRRHFDLIRDSEGSNQIDMKNYLFRCLFFEITIDFSSYKEVKSLFEGSEQGDDFNNDNGDGNFEGLASLFG
jgi:hypothetical protein